MNVVSSHIMASIEKLAISEGESEEDFMEEAGSGVALLVHDYAESYNLDHHVILACGKGNNAGDAYVAGIHLIHLDYEVHAIQLAPIEHCSPLCQKNYDRFIREGGKILNPFEGFEPVQLNGIIIDGIFGTGFHGTVEEPYASLITILNNSKLPIISIDIPSGLDGTTGEVKGPAIVATETAFLELPKTGFFLQDGWNHIGRLRYVDFGLPQEFIDEEPKDMIMTTHDLVKPYLPPIVRNRHKYQAGYVVGLAGSPELPGAAILSSTAALQSGAGIVKLLYPEGMQGLLVGTPAEIIKLSYQPSNEEAVLEALNKAGATFIGPGLGITPQTIALLKYVLPRLTKPCVIDADALTIIASENIKIPANAILTPHLGEMKRLLHRKEDIPRTLDGLAICKAYAEKNNTTLVLKGGPSFIFHPGEYIIANPSGDPGMATAGSGDVLTGLLASLLAQGCTPHHAATLGVFLHGLAGEYAQEDLSSYCMMASDIMYRFPDAFNSLNY